MADIFFDAVSFYYPGMELPALKSLCLEIPSGSFVGIIGSGNAGKSTLCGAISGIVPGVYNGRMEGRVTIDGRKISGPVPHRVGMVLQHPAYQISGLRFTVFEEVAFGLENRGIDECDIRQRVSEALAVTQIGDLADRSPYQLSGGQQQRLAIASSLVGDPDILVLDSPTTFLDPAGGEELFDLLAVLNRKGKTIVIAEHRLEWLAVYASRIIGLMNGEKIMDGTPQDVLTSSRIRKIGLAWTRYTQTAELARNRGVWDEDRPLPITLETAIRGFGG